MLLLGMLRKFWKKDMKYIYIYIISKKSGEHNKVAV